MTVITWLLMIVCIFLWRLSERLGEIAGSLQELKYISNLIEIQFWEQREKPLNELSRDELDKIHQATS